MTRGLTAQVIVLWFTLGRSVAAVEPEEPTWTDISPIFEERCVNCHSALGAAKGLRLDSYAKTVEGSENGPVLLAGDVSGSELIRRLRGEKTPRMPFLSRPLPPEEIAIIVRWIEAGLPEYDSQ